MKGISAADLLQRARRSAGLSQAALALRAGVPQSVLSAYERGRREPRVDALTRVLDAAVFRLRLQRGVDVHQVGRVLPQLLELAEALPRRSKGALAYPRLP